MENTRNQQQQQQILSGGVEVGQHGSVGGAIGVVVVIAVMGMIAVLVGRLCSGRRVMGYGAHMDAESWVESKCSACVDGNLTPPRYPPRPLHFQTPLPIPTPIIPMRMTTELRTDQEEQEQQEQQQQQQQQQQQHQQHPAETVANIESPQHHHHQQSMS